MGSVKDDTNQPFPPGSWLGFGIDMISNTPTSISSVSNYLDATMSFPVFRRLIFREISEVLMAL